MPGDRGDVQGGVFALGTIDFVKAVVDTKAGSSLADDRGLQARHRAGRRRRDRPTSSSTSPASGPASRRCSRPTREARYETEVKPFLEPFEAFAAVAEAPGTTAVARAVITFTK